MDPQHEGFYSTRRHGLSAGRDKRANHGLLLTNIKQLQVCTTSVRIFLLVESSLKVLTNEKRGGLRVISFDRSPLKIISRKFSKESVLAPSCERHKTTQRTLFQLFANNSWFPIVLLCLAATHFSHHTLNWNIGIVHPPRYLRWR